MRIRQLALGSICCLICAFAFSAGVHAQASDPLAELEAWNKIKESTVAADYHTFLQQFPSGSLSTRAREKMNSLGDPVWNELKKSNDPFKYRDYIKANPNSPFLDQAKARLEVLTVATIEWEKAKAIGTLEAMMRFIAADPTGPYSDEAKAGIEPELWKAILASQPLNLLEFYVTHYSMTTRGQEAATMLASGKATLAKSTFEGIKARVEALNGKKVLLRPTKPGAVSTDVWFENIVASPCRIEFGWNSFLLRNSTRYNYGYVQDVRLFSPRTHFDADTNTTTVFAKPLNGGKIKIPFLAFGPDGNLIVLPVTHLDANEMAALTTNDHAAAQSLFEDLTKLIELCKQTK